MRKKPIISLALIIFLLGNAPHAGAFFLDKLFNKAITPDSQILTLSSTITSVDDVNKNGLNDGGDTIRFGYTIDNPTEKEISLATLRTNIPRNYLNFIHNIQGTMNLSDVDSTVTIPNLRINPGEKLLISFDARLNYFTDVEKTIFTEPEIITSDKKSLIKSERKELKAKTWKGKTPSSVNMRQKK